VEVIKTKIDLGRERLPTGEQEAVFEARDVSVYYGDQRAIDKVNIDIYRR
jgi:hypothetical protein